MQVPALEGGFTDAPVESANAFRKIMMAMAYPGKIVQISGAEPTAPLSSAAGVVILCLCDADTPVFLAPDFNVASVRDWISFHTGAPLVHDPEAAQFAVGHWDALPLADFRVGTPEYPDRSATLIVETSSLSSEGACLRGPGIKETAALSLPEQQAFQCNAALFPLGLDFFFTQGVRLAALPRTTQVS